MLAFAGMTSQCARCHDHHLTVPNQDDPMWTQDDNYGLYAFLATKNSAATKLTISGSRTGQPVQPHWVVDGYAKAVPVGDPSLPTLTDPIATRRAKFGDLLVSSNAFARGTAHRIFAEVMDPLLDPNQFLAANMANVANPALLDALTQQFQGQQFSLRGYLRVILNSKVYQLTTVGTTTANDALLARRTVRRHHSEVIDQAVNQVAGTTYKGSSSFIQDVFGYPRHRATIIDRSDAVNLGQTLVLLNSTQSTNGLVTQGSSDITKLASQVDAKTLTLAQAITAIFESSLNRDPTATELSTITGLIASAKTTQEGLEDVAVALCSTAEFVSR
jgi:hypothetical protein